MRYYYIKDLFTGYVVSPSDLSWATNKLRIGDTSSLFDGSPRLYKSESLCQRKLDFLDDSMHMASKKGFKVNIDLRLMEVDL